MLTKRQLPGTREPRWHNWARNQECAPAAIERPRSEDELAAIVARAAREGRRVKVVGTGHSFTAIALTDGYLVRLDRYQRLLDHDPARRRVTVQAGISIARLNAELAKRGLAMPNLGDIEYQTISGAIATATHGTGKHFGGLATFVCGMRIVAGDGTVVACDETVNTDVLRVARVGLGALGIVSTVTLQCVEAFNLKAVEKATRVDELLESLDEHVDANDHFEFFWMPHTEWALAKWNNRTAETPSRPGRVAEFRDDILYGNLAFSAACRIGRRRPALIPRLARAVPGSGNREYVDRSDRVFTSPRLTHFYEMEYSIDRGAAVEALNRVRRFIAQSGLRISFPVEMRFTASDDIPLSTATARDNCYIAVHVYSGTHYQQYFEAVEDIMLDYGGRPHWGKLHFQTHQTLRPRYPEWHAFQAMRLRLDPEGRFTNPYLDRVLGPIGGD